jgi:hypothetical protein
LSLVGKRTEKAEQERKVLAGRTGLEPEETGDKGPES